RGLGISPTSKTDGPAGAGRGVFRKCGYTSYACCFCSSPLIEGPERLILPAKCGLLLKKVQKIKDASASLANKRKQRMVFRHPPFLSSLAFQFEWPRQSRPQ